MILLIKDLLSIRIIVSYDTINRDIFVAFLKGRPD